MDRPQPQRLTRAQLSSFLGSPELVRAFEAYIKALAEIVPDELSELQLGVAAGAALQDVLANAAEMDRRDTEGARLLALSGQVEQLREQIALIPDDSALQMLSGQLAQLTEQVMAGVNQLRRKRTVQNSIPLGAGTASATYTISPALANVDLADLALLGATAAAGAGTTDAQVSIELTNVTTITARRVGTAVAATAYFRLTEYTQ